MKTIPSDLLRTFVAVVETGSLTEAAKVVHRTQSAVSLQLHRIESLINGPIFKNKGKVMSLTNKGQIVLEYARQILALNDECMSHINGELMKGVINIGIPADFALTIFPHILRKFVEENPEVTLNVQCELSHDLVQSLEDHNLDIVLAIHDNEPTYKLQNLWKDPLVWVMNRKIKFDSGLPIPLVLFPNQCRYRERILNSFRSNNIEPKAVYCSSNFTSNLAAIECGLRISALSKSTTPTNLKTIKLIKFYQN